MSDTSNAYPASVPDIVDTQGCRIPPLNRPDAGVMKGGWVRGNGRETIAKVGHHVTWHVLTPHGGQAGSVDPPHCTPVGLQGGYVQWRQFCCIRQRCIRQSSKVKSLKSCCYCYKHQMTQLPRKVNFNGEKKRKFGQKCPVQVFFNRIDSCFLLLTFSESLSDHIEGIVFVGKDLKLV